MAYLCVNTPHIDVYVKKEYLYDGQKGHGELVEGIWVTAKSIQGRALYFERSAIFSCSSSVMLLANAMKIKRYNGNPVSVVMLSSAQ